MGDVHVLDQLIEQAYERGVAAGRGQAADALRRAADSTRETYVRDAFKLAARIAEGAPAEPVEEATVNTRNRRNDDFMKTPLWFKIWFTFCAVLGLGLLGVGVWAVVTLVNWVSTR